MPIGILGAMQEEVALLQSDLQAARTEAIGGRTYPAGTLYG
jgi:nucleoside phosphorylase